MEFVICGDFNINSLKNSIFLINKQPYSFKLLICFSQLIFGLELVRFPVLELIIYLLTMAELTHIMYFLMVFLTMRLNILY